jgi:heme oxygenase
MLSEELKQKTEKIHTAAEKIMIGWLKKIRSGEDYVEFLNWLYGYYSPLEERIKLQLGGGLLPDLDKRLRADHLLNDMEETGLPLPAPQHCPHLPLIDTYGKALGALYVLEGSTLGGRIIAGLMARQLGSEKSLSYFASYGNETAGMWQSFKDFLDNIADPGVGKDACAAANETFLTFKNWIEKHELQPQL